jgi:hypothetical protein
VLLKNAGPTLPFSTGVKSVAVVGPLGNNQADLLGPWYNHENTGRPADPNTSSPRNTSTRR